MNPGHVSWRAAVLCCFRGLLRKCQVTMSDSTLQRGDFRFFDWGMIITIRRTKTIQFRQRVLQVPIARCLDARLCAVAWTERHFRELQAGDEDLAFRVPVGEGLSAPLPYGAYQSMLKMFARKAGINPDDISSHSLRRWGVYVSCHVWRLGRGIENEGGLVLGQCV